MGLFSKAKEKSEARLRKYEVSDEMLRAFIGPKADYYMGARDKTSMFGWNWPAFLFGVAWLAYRKQYWLAIFIMLLCFIPFMRGIGGPVAFVLAMYSRYFYYAWAHEKIAKINKKTTDPVERARLYAKKGGVSVSLAVIFSVLIIVQAGWYVYLAITNVVHNPAAQQLNQ